MIRGRANARPGHMLAPIGGRYQHRRMRARAKSKESLAPPASECICSFGATRVGALIERVRLHVTTDRFLAGRRGDKMWEAACDYAALALARLESRLRPTVLAEWICAPASTGRAAERCGPADGAQQGGRR